MRYFVNHIRIPIFLTLLLCIALPADLLAQLTDTTGTGSGMRGAPHVYKYDTRTTALGDATVADPTNLSVININPASLAFVRNFEVIQFNTFQNWNNNLMLNNATLPVYRDANNRLAAQVGISNSGLNTTNPLGGNQQPEPELNLYQVDLAYSYSYENVISVGVYNNTTLSQNSDAKYWTNFTTIGMLYAPSPTLSYGMVVRGIGRSVVYNITQNGNTTLGSQNLRESLELGANIRFPVEADDTNVSLSLANEKRFGENGIWYKVGLEVIAESIVAIRGGYVLHPESRLYAPRFGLGFIADFVQVDYSVSLHERLYERYHQLGITIQLDN